MSVRRALLGVGAAVVLLAAGACLGPVERPTVSLSWCPDGSEGRLDYWFTSTSTTVPGHAIAEVVWDFGDGSPPILSWGDILHRFSAAGTYHVTLTAADTRGVTGTTTETVVVEPAAFIHSTWNLTLGFPPTVAGIVENRSTERLRSVVVRAKFYDADGVRLTDGRFEVIDLEPGEKAAFEIHAVEFASRVFHATVDVESFAADCQTPYRGL
jgi:PKD repeat protein